MSPNERQRIEDRVRKIDYELRHAEKMRKQWQERIVELEEERDALEKKR